MFGFTNPWWELVLRGAVVYAVLLLMMRLSGKRTVGQFTPFDFLVVMLLSEAVGPSLSGGDDSVFGGLTVAATLVVLNLSVSVISARSRRLEKLFEGTPVLLGRDGEIFDKVRKSQHVGEGDVHKALREADCPLKDMRYLFLETDGAISVLKKEPGPVTGSLG